MRMRVAAPNAMTRFNRTFVLSSVVLTALLGAVATSRSAESSNPWERGEYRDVKPQAPAAKASSGVTVRSIGPVLKLERTAVQRPRLSPGDPTSLLAEYSVTSPAGTIDVKETRIIEFNGTVLSKLVKTVSRSNGPAGSEYQMRIPQDAAEGWYTVTTVLEPAKVTMRSIATEQANTAFYIETPQAAEPPSAIERPQKEGESPRVEPDGGIKIKLGSDKPRYKVGDTITMRFETNRDAYLTLVNVGTSGKITILFPNRFSGGHEIKGKQVYTIPAPDDSYELAVSGPPGVELIYALVTSKPVKFVETDFSQTPEIFRTVTGDTPVLTRDINAVVKKTPLKGQAKAVLELEVVP